MALLYKQKLPHVRQSYGWDCGIACLRMILRYSKLDEEKLPVYLKHLSINTSVWTIDLAYLLSKYGMKTTFYSINCEVNEDYSQLAFYKQNMEEDKLRLDNLFKNAKTHGIQCFERHVSIENLAKLVDHAVIIALVDANYLYCIDCGDSLIAKCSKLGCCSGFQSYQGHFIVVTGFAVDSQLVYYQNPNACRNLCWCTVDTFNIARQATGTDEDLLVIPLHPGEGGDFTESARL